MAGCEFDPVIDVKAFAAYENRLKTKNPDWPSEFLHKQALIVFNTEMYPLQVKSYFDELNGKTEISTGQIFNIVNGRLESPHYDFPNMINYATSKQEKESMINFQEKAVEAKTGEKIFVLDLSTVGKGGGVKYLDIYEKKSEVLVKHKKRIDLTGDKPDLTLKEAEEIVKKLEFPEESEIQGLQEIRQFNQSVILPEVLPQMMPLVDIGQFQPMPKIQFETEMPIQVSSEAGFWFEAMAAVTEPIIQNKQNVAEMPSVEVPTRSVLVGQKITERIRPTGSNPEGAVGQRKEGKVTEKKIEKLEVIVFKPAAREGEKKRDIRVEEKREKKAEAVVEQQPTRTDLVGSKKEEKKIIVKSKVKISRLVWQRKEKKLVLEKVKQVELVPEKQAEKREERIIIKKVIWQREIKQPEKARMEVKLKRQKEPKKKVEPVIPIWAAELNPVEVKEIPWWQPNLMVNGGLIEAERIVVLTIFFLIVNTKAELEGKKMRK